MPINGTATFTVSVAGGGANVRYQWRHNGGNLPGQIGSTLVVSNVQPADAGTYAVAVFTDSAALTSDPAELHVTNIPAMVFGDKFDSAPVLNGTTGLVQSVNVGATAEPGEPSHAGRPARRSVWVQWPSPTFGGIVTFRTAGSGFDTLLAVYRGFSISNLIEAASDDDSGPFLTSEVSFRTQPQTLYYIAVDGLAGASGPIVLNWGFEPTAETLPVITSQPVDQVVAPGSDVLFSTGASNEANVVWQWFFNGQPLSNQTSSNLVLKNVGPADVGSYFCRALTGRRSTDTRLIRLQLNVNEFGVTDTAALTTEKLFDSRLRFDAKGKGKRLKVVAHGFSGTQIFSTLGSAKEPGEPNHCGIVGGASEWFAYQADTNGTIYLDTDGSNFDTVLAVYTGPGDDFATLVSVACDNNSGLDGKDSRVSFAGTAGTVYWIAVDGVNNPTTGQPARGSVALHYRLVMPLKLTATAYTNATGGKLTFRVSGTPNLAATIQAATNLAGTNWISLTTNSSATGAFSYTNTGVNALSNRYYRAMNQF